MLFSIWQNLRVVWKSPTIPIIEWRITRDVFLTTFPRLAATITNRFWLSFWLSSYVVLESLSTSSSGEYKARLKDAAYLLLLIS